MTDDKIVDRVARAIHAADKTHSHEPYADVKDLYEAMARAAIDTIEKEQQ
jgi:hypothetical protein